MNEYTTTILILVIVLIGTNKKEIATYIAWLRFKIHVTLKQYENDRRNHSNIEALKKHSKATYKHK